MACSLPIMLLLLLLLKGVTEQQLPIRLRLWCMTCHQLQVGNAPTPGLALLSCMMADQQTHGHQLMTL